jgi:hypothetical protein
MDLPCHVAVACSGRIAGHRRLAGGTAAGALRRHRSLGLSSVIGGGIAAMDLSCHVAVACSGRIAGNRRLAGGTAAGALRRRRSLGLSGVIGGGIAAMDPKL